MQSASKGSERATDIDGDGGGSLFRDEIHG